MFCVVLRMCTQPQSESYNMRWTSLLGTITQGALVSRPDRSGFTLTKMQYEVGLHRAHNLPIDLKSPLRNLGESKPDPLLISNLTPHACPDSEHRVNFAAGSCYYIANFSICV